MANRKKITSAKKHKRIDVLREDSPPYHANGNGAHRKLKFIDLFCGIGGFHIAFERAGCECVFSSDWGTRLAVGQQEAAARGAFDTPDSADFGLKPYPVASRQNDTEDLGGMGYLLPHIK
jgi:hypothetical protein